MHILRASSLLWLIALVSNVHAQSSISAQDATSFALTYGYPLLAFEKVRIVVNVTGVNKWLHFRQLQTPTNKAVVKPNVDTLYSAMVYDISHDDLLVSIPESIPESQFHLISFFDPYGTNYANIGTLNTNTSGTYRLQPRTVSASPDISSGNGTSVVATLETSSIYGFILIRWLVNNTNLDALHGWQDQTLNATSPATVRGPSLASLPVFDSSSSAADNVVRLLTKFAPCTLPDSTTQAENVTATLAIAGISNSTYSAPQGVDLNTANRSAVASAVSAAAASTATTTLTNGWTVANSSLIAIYDDNYAFRAAIANGGYLAIKAPNAIYPGWTNGSSSTTLGGDITLGANEALILTFSGKPPLTETGFWSLTAYQDNYLIANQYNIYAITSERSNLTYADGTAVNASSTNQTFQLLVQPADIAPPSNWTNNFLPGPAGGGAMALTLRLYDAQQSLLDGDWIYPSFSRQAAVGTKSGNTSTTSTTTTATASSTSSSSTTSGTVTPSAYKGGSVVSSVSAMLLVASSLLAVFIAL